MALSKTTALAITAAIITVLLVSGTFAWVNFSQSIINQFTGEGENPGGTLHDDFDGVNKDVYIENWGSTPIFVRIKLDEYMELGLGAGFKSKSSLDGVPVPDPDNHAIPLIEGTLLDMLSTWITHVPMAMDKPDACDTDADFHRYWQWHMGGQKYYYPAPISLRSNVVNSIEMSNGYVDQSSPESIIPGSLNVDGIAARQTPFAQVMTMAYWKGINKPIGNYWVIDIDGWAYWAAPLQPNSATGLLLNRVLRIDTPIDQYYYAIDVIAQMATKSGKNDDDSPSSYNNFGDPDNGGWTDDGHELMDIITGGTAAGPYDALLIMSNKTLIGNKIFAKAGEDVALYSRGSGNAGDSANWGTSAIAGFDYTQLGGSSALVAISPTASSGSIMAITAVSKSNSNIYDSKMLIVIPNEAQSVIAGTDGFPYIIYADNTRQKVNLDGTFGPLLQP
jgi:hypothetical protein